MKGATGSWTEEYSRIDVLLLSLSFNFFGMGSLSSLFLKAFALPAISSNWYLNLSPTLSRLKRKECKFM
jgi:hypothetical protein